jgi:small conductance mechanosensitive channel
VPFGKYCLRQFWGAAIVNRTTYPGTGELKVSFPVRARATAQAIGDEILQDLRDDPRVDG